jgi:hypothetical protein
MTMRRYLLVLDMDLLALDEELDLQPINYLVAQQEQQPCEVVVLSLVATRQAKLSPLELVLGAATGHAQQAPAKYPTAPRAHNYDEVILATGRQGGARLARWLRLDPVHRLRRRWGQRLTVFASGPATRPGQ